MIIDWLKMDIEQILIRHRIKRFSKMFLFNHIVLDAGAGTKQYEDCFDHCQYDSCDSKAPFFKGYDHTMSCDLDDIPVKDGNYDCVICTQVLEHLKAPHMTLLEFNRILKEGGYLIMTVPQQAGLHAEPHHYFNFTKYGLKYMLDNTGFNTKSIKPLGGIFYYIGRRLKVLPQYIFFQNYKRSNIFNCLVAILILPVCWLLSPLLYLFDWLDVNKYDTLGNFVVARKGNE